MFEKSEKEAMGELVKRGSTRGGVFLFHDRHNHGFAACGFDLLERRLAEAVRVNGELLGEFTIAEHFDLYAAALNEARVAEHRFGHFRASGELLEITEVHAHDRDRERAIEAALGQATLNRGLTTLKVELADVATVAGFLALLAATAGLTEARPDAATEALLEVTRASRRGQMRENF
jgi:hypothetical protein